MNDNITIEGELNQAFTQDIADAPYWNRDQDDEETDGDDDDEGDDPDPDADADADLNAEADTETETDANVPTTETETEDTDEHRSETETETDAMRNTGETVSGTSGDDLGSAVTTTLPDGVEAADLTETQRAIIDTWLINRTASSRTIAERVGCSRSYAAETLDRFCDHQFADRPASPTTGDAETETATEETETESGAETGTGTGTESNSTGAWAGMDRQAAYEELTPTQQRVVDAIARYPDRTNAEVAGAADCSTSYVSPIKTTYPQLIAQRREDLGERDETDSDSDLDSESKSECEDRSGDAATPASADTDGDAGKTPTDERTSSETTPEAAVQPAQATLTDERFTHEFQVAAQAIKATAQSPETEQAIDHLVGIWQEQAQVQEQDQEGDR